jgi:BTB/POZ domain
MFAGKLSSARDSQGRIFIDRDGSHFAIILNYLRNGAYYELPASLTRDQLQALMSEADFYALSSLKTKLATAINSKQHSIGCVVQYRHLDVYTATAKPFTELNRLTDAGTCLIISLLHYQCRLSTLQMLCVYILSLERIRTAVDATLSCLYAYARVHCLLRVLHIKQGGRSTHLRS